MWTGIMSEIMRSGYFGAILLHLTLWHDQTSYCSWISLLFIIQAPCQSVNIYCLINHQKSKERTKEKHWGKSYWSVIGKIRRGMRVMAKGREKKRERRNQTQEGEEEGRQCRKEWVLRCYRLCSSKDGGWQRRRKRCEGWLDWRMKEKMKGGGEELERRWLEQTQREIKEREKVKHEKKAQEETGS